MSLRTRVFIVFLLIISVSLLLTVFLVHRSIQAEGYSRIEEALKVGERVFVDKLTTSLDDLQRNSRLIASNEAMMQAINDGPVALQASVTEALQELNENDSTHLLWLLDAEGNIVAQTGVSNDLSRFPFPSMLEKAKYHGAHSAIAPLANELYQLSIIALSTSDNRPDTVHWMITGTRFSRETAQQMGELTGLELLLVDDIEKIIWTYSLDSAPDNRALETYALNDPNESFEFSIDHLQFLGKKLELSDHLEGAVSAILLKSSKDIQSQLLRLHTQLSISGLIVLLAAILLTGYLSRSVVKPISELVATANAIGRGEYDCSSVQVSGQSAEIATLSAAFNTMQKDIAERERQIEFIAFHDPLTQLNNRHAFANTVYKQITVHQQQPFAICILDFNNFREINDTLGHHHGDQVLLRFAQRLTSIASEEIDIARIGGDEFGVLIRSMTRLDNVLQHLQSLTEEPIDVEQIALEIRISIGVALYPEHGDTASSLLQHAEIPMYLAKKEHKPFAFYDKSRDHHSRQRLALITELRSAISKNQMQLHYQPKLYLNTGQFRSVECLIRWIHPEYGFVNPDDFIHLAEQTGEVKAITRWVIKTALQQVNAWRNEGYIINAAINISAIDLNDSHLPEVILSSLAQYQLPVQAMTLEITESAVMHDIGQAMTVLNALSDHGLRFSIDDYGQGYSSMAQLTRIPVSELKIDKAFVMNLDESPKDRAIVKSTIELAHNLGLDVVAEGVESERILTILSELGCDYIQGFYISRPLDTMTFNQWLIENRQQILTNV